MAESSIIIVGAGAAGLAAGQILSAAGCRVTILEARNRIGGRIFTVHDPGFRTPVELGAEFIHGTPEATWKIVNAVGLVAYDVPFEHMEKRGSRWIGPPHYADGLAKAMSGLPRLGRKDMSFADYLEQRRRSKRAVNARRAALDFVKGFDAADPELVSAKSLAEEQEGLGDLEEQMQFRLLDGYGTMIEAMRSGLHPRRVKLLLDSKVTRIDWQAGRVSVHCQGSRNVIHARRILITLPLGILQLAPGAAGAVQFVPDIPEKRAASRRLGSGAVIKVILGFRSAFWERLRPKGKMNMAKAVFLHDPTAPFPTWWTMRPLHAAMLTGWLGGPDASAMSKLSLNSIREQAVRSVLQLFGMEKKRLMEELAAFHCHNWPADPWARGAYSYVKVGGSGAHRRLAEPMQDTLFFAGEATDISGEASTVAGALASGARAAGEILHSLG